MNKLEEISKKVFLVKFKKKSKKIAKISQKICENFIDGKFVKILGETLKELVKKFEENLWKLDEKICGNFVENIFGNVFSFFEEILKKICENFERN